MAEDPESPDPDLAGLQWDTCAACDGTPNAGENRCRACDGTGRVEADEQEMAGVAPWVVEVLEAAGFIDRFGLDAWRRVHGEPAEALFEAVRVFEDELDRLGHEERSRRAKDERRRRKR